MNWQSNKHKCHFIYFINIKIKKILVIIITIFFISSFWITYYFIDCSLKPIAIRNILSDTSIYCEKMINKSIYSVLNENYNDICIVERNENGQIASISYNTNKINKIKIKLSESIIKCVEDISVTKTAIPIGNLTNSVLLSEIGPKIPVKIEPNGNPKIEFINDFVAVGINQTKHKISIKIGMELEIYFSGTKNATTVSTECPITETIIVGNIPNVYGLK